MSFKILNTIGEVYTAEARPILESLGQVDYLNLSQNELSEKIADYDAAVIGLGLNFDKAVLSQAKKLKVIATATTGLDHIDLETAKKQEIEVLSLRGENEFLDTITGTAELAFGLMIILARLIEPAFESVKNYEWDRERFRGHSLYGGTLGVVGVGRLGRWICRYGKAFGMKVLGADPNVKLDPSLCQQVSFDELLEKSDFVSIHVHLTPETENMFNQSVFKKMKPTAYLINTSRGKIVNEADLLEALEKKMIAGYATDVLADQLNFGKTFGPHPLVEYAKTHNNLIIVPHLGGMTFESRAATDLFIAEKLVRYLKKD